MVKLLLSCGASPLDENKAGMTPVHLAARHGHSSVISEFVKQNISLRNLRYTVMSSCKLILMFAAGRLE